MTQHNIAFRLTCILCHVDSGNRQVRSQTGQSAESGMKRNAFLPLLPPISNILEFCMWFGLVHNMGSFVTLLQSTKYNKHAQKKLHGF